MPRRRLRGGSSSNTCSFRESTTPRRTPAASPDLLRGLDCHVNVIPHNPFPGSPFRAPERAETLRFHDQIKGRGLKGIIRWPRGRDVAGACGQLALLGR